MTYAGPGQSDRLSAGDTDYTANALGIGYQTDGTDRYDFTRDDTGNPVGLRDGSDNYYLITDSIGSVVAVSDEDGDVAATYRYEPYGKITSGGPGGSPAVDNPYTFAGYYRDDGTGLYKAGERYYDPGSGTWTQKDPLMQIQSPNEANPYVYAGADPVNRVDPRGTDVPGIVCSLTCSGASPVDAPDVYISPESFPPYGMNPFGFAGRYVTPVAAGCFTSGSAGFLQSYRYGPHVATLVTSASCGFGAGVAASQVDP